MSIQNWDIEVIRDESRLGSRILVTVHTPDGEIVTALSFIGDRSGLGISSHFRELAKVIDLKLKHHIVEGVPNNGHS